METKIEKISSVDVGTLLLESAKNAQLRSQGYNILCERVSLPNGRVTNTFRYTLLESS